MQHDLQADLRALLLRKVIIIIVVYITAHSKGPACKIQYNA